MAKSGPRAAQSGPRTAVLEVSSRDGVAQSRFFENPGSLKRPKTDLRRLGWHSRGSRWAKNDVPEAGPEMGSKNEAKKGVKMRGFGIVKTFQSAVRSSKIKVYGFLETL